MATYLKDSQVKKGGKTRKVGSRVVASTKRTSELYTRLGFFDEEGSLLGNRDEDYTMKWIDDIQIIQDRLGGAEGMSKRSKKANFNTKLEEWYRCEMANARQARRPHLLHQPSHLNLHLLQKLQHHSSPALQSVELHLKRVATRHLLMNMATSFVV